MASDVILDKRILARRNSESPSAAESELPDLAERIFEPSEEDVEAFRLALTQEQSLRAERVVRALERAAKPPEAPPMPEILLDGLDDLDLADGD